jgi:pimeloyl-ACP methyl ester carboxylesterase
MEIAGLLDELIPNSRKIEIPGTGHLAHMERPAEFNRHLLDFLGSVGGS